jgi:hypothetical protein
VLARIQVADGVELFLRAGEYNRVCSLINDQLSQVGLADVSLFALCDHHILLHAASVQVIVPPNTQRVYWCKVAESFSLNLEDLFSQGMNKSSGNTLKVVQI